MKAPHEVPWSKGQRIKTLIVDDSDFARVSVKKFLAGLPALEVVGEAAGGFEALEMAVAKDPHLVIMDIRMEGMDGLQATRLIRREHPASRVILMSIDNFAGLKEASLAHG